MTEPQPFPPPDGFTSFEQLVVDSANRGEVADGGTLTETDSPSNFLRAELIRELLRGRHGAVDPRGIRVVGARIVGSLELDWLEADVGLALIACVIPGSISASNAHLPYLNLSGSYLPALYAENLRVTSSLILTKANLHSNGETGAIQLLGAQVGAHVDLSSAEIINDNGPALAADGLHAGRNVVLQGATIRGCGEASAIRLLGAHVGGQVNFAQVQIINESGPAIAADGLRSDGELIVTQATIHGSGEASAIRLLGAHIGRQINFAQSQITNESGPALAADGLISNGDLRLEMIHLRGTGENGAIRLPGAHVGGQSNVVSAEISNDSGPAIVAQGFRSDGDVVMKGIVINAADGEGAVQMPNASTGPLLLEHARISNSDGPALIADNLVVNGTLSLQGTHGRGGGDRGAIRLLGAHVIGQANFMNTKITNESGPALTADVLRIDLDMTTEKAALRGTGELGAVRLSGARIGGQLNLTASEITNDSGPALVADEVRIEGILFLDEMTVHGSDKAGSIDLIGAQVHSQMSARDLIASNDRGPIVTLHGTCVDGPVYVPATAICPEPNWVGRGACPHYNRQISLNRFTFSDLGAGKWNEWLHLIRHHTLTYRPQPYQQLAATERAAGHENNARQILIAQQDDLRRRTPHAIGSRMAQIRHRAWGWIGRYGYRSSRIVVILFAMLILLGSTGWLAGQVDTRPGHHAAERVLALNTPIGAPGTPCSAIELIGLGLDRGLPLGVTGLRARCDLDTSTRRGEAFTALIWLLQGFVWALATLAIVSYTGLIRKPT